ncbi:M15 family metallopeptidase [uncultured Endozoicomonas sp.]|uniref:M15 family metallopeptidase n=1 Tax=uncultured Endozoicomonas sp. TaxID=432652 RepID=UPI00260C64A7|nr:M15 family metallopeptidase [uncultured Endozoicomonas sp.]
MPAFSQRSKDRLATCHPDLQRLMNKVVERYDISIICGHRGEEEQEKAFREGKSKARFGQSKHNSYPSRAVDVIPWPFNQDDWKDCDYFNHMAGYIMAVADELGIRIRWGGDWNMNRRTSDETFLDMPHFELMD